MTATHPAALHDKVIGRITAMAAQRGLLWHYCGRSLHCRGCHGLPDLIIAGPGGLAFAEVKTGGQLDPGQQAWRDTLRVSGAAWNRWDPADLWNGRIERELDRLAGN